MRNLLCLAAVVSAGLGALAAGPQGARPAAANVPTYTKDVAPILYKNCTSCHRPGEIAPMSLLTYDDVRPHARDIRDQIAEGAMPPWHAAMPPKTSFNERSLTAAEKSTILRWVANGAPKGNPKESAAGAPVPARLVKSARPGRHPGNAGGLQGPGRRRDRVPSISTFRRTSPRRSGCRPSRSGRGTAESCPSSPRQLQGSSRHAAAARAEVQHRSAPNTAGRARVAPRSIRDNVPARLIATYAPGTNPQVFRPGMAIRLEPGGVSEEPRCTTRPPGNRATNRTQVGLIFSKGFPSPREVRASQFVNATLRSPPAPPTSP